MDIKKVRLELVSVKEVLRVESTRKRLRARLKSCLRSGFWSIVSLHAFGIIAAKHLPYALVATSSVIVAAVVIALAIRNWRLLRDIAGSAKAEDEPKTVDVFDAYVERVDHRLGDGIEKAVIRFVKAAEAFERANRAEWAYRYDNADDGAITHGDAEWNRLRDVSRRATDELDEASICMRGAYSGRAYDLHRHAYFAAKELEIDFRKNA